MRSTVYYALRFQVLPGPDAADAAARVARFCHAHGVGEVVLFTGGEEVHPGHLSGVEEDRWFDTVAGAAGAHMGCPPGLRPLLRRNDVGTGLVNGESDDGGLDELVESKPNRRFNSAFSARRAAPRPRITPCLPHNQSGKARHTTDAHPRSPHQDHFRAYDQALQTT